MIDGSYNLAGKNDTFMCMDCNREYEGLDMEENNALCYYCLERIKAESIIGWMEISIVTENKQSITFG